MSNKPYGSSSRSGFGHQTRVGNKTGNGPRNNKFDPNQWVPPDWKDVEAEFVTQIDTRTENRGSIVIDFGLDISGSMQGVFPQLATDINQVCLPAFNAAADDYKKAIRIGCTLFACNVGHGWLGYKSLKQLGTTALKTDFASSRPELGGSTSLHAGTIHAYTQGRMAAEWLFAATAKSVSHKLVILTDGQNTNSPDVSEVSKRLRAISNPAIFQSLLIYYETGAGLNKNQIETMSRQMGFGKYLFFGKDGLSVEKRRAGFRHELDIWSRQVR